jgi:dienelactone hydrolase
MKAVFVALVVLLLGTLADGKIVTKPIQYEQNGTKLQGYLAYDDALSAKGKLPGVLLVHEWWGLNDYIKGRTEQIAQMGYAAFAVDMYGDGQTTTDPAKAKELTGPFHGGPLIVDRAKAGLDAFLKTGVVDETKVAAIGFCFGGAACLTLAYSGAPVAGVVTFHGALVPPQADAAEKTKAKFLILHGAIDPMVGKEQVDSFTKAMNDAKLDYELIQYSGAIHAFTNPDADKIREASGLKGIGYNAEAAKRSWDRMQVFFKEIFGA